MTIDDITALPPEDAIQHHDRVDEQDERFQEGLHLLAQRCGACGQALPEVSR
jgi:hypothetical protein